MTSFTIIIWEQVIPPKTPPLETKGCPPHVKKMLALKGNGQISNKYQHKSQDPHRNQKNNKKSGISQFKNIFKNKGYFE